LRYLFKDVRFLFFQTKIFSRGKVMSKYDAVKICIPSEKGKVLAALHDGALVCEESNEESKDDQWLFVKVPEPPALVFPNAEIQQDGRDGYNIVSANFRLVMDYNPSTGEQISVVPYNEVDRTHTIWHVTEDDEIFTYDRDGNRKYLWSVLGNVYVTPDEHLAETWKAVSLEGFDTPLVMSSSAPEERGGYIIWLILAILALLAYLLVRRR
jgi:hypothetical protein